jgi:FtsP/CotA-like multicopper oxidase with cupredoxin domain
MALTRRDLLSLAVTGGPLLLGRERLSALEDSTPDVRLRIARTKIETSLGNFVQTTAYNGTSPAPLLRLREGVPAHVEITNETDTEEYVHWHGFLIPARIDGAMEEKSLPVPARGKLNYVLVPQPAGARYVHSHAMAGRDLTLGTYSGQFGFVYIAPKNDPARYDQEIFLATHEWDAYLTNDELEEEAFETPEQKERERAASGMEPDHWEVAYKIATMNGKALGHGEPIRVKEGQRVLFHVLNASATENIRLSLPGHRFRVIALDGNPVPKQGIVDILELGAGERVDAIVEMRAPGVWIFGSNDDVLRDRGMGVVVEYAGKTGVPTWKDPTGQDWDYTLFANGATPAKEDVTLPMIIDRIMQSPKGFEQWLINGHAYSETDKPTALVRGKRYRFAFHNKSDDWHPLHFHRSRFELVRIDGKLATGIKKDVFVIKPFGTAEVDWVPTETGLTLFHCHQQLHMDSGFKMVFDVVWP